MKKLSVAKWERVVTTFVKLFKTTTPHQLFDENLRMEADGTPDVADSPGQCINTFQMLSLTLPNS